MKKITAFFLSFIIIISFAISCTIGKTPKIRVANSKLVSLAGEKASAFMLIINDGEVSDVLIGCSIKEFPSTQGELHDVINGKMQKIEEINIPSKEVTVLKKGTLHLMFFNMPEKLGNEVTLVLTFRKSGIIEVKTPIIYSRP